MTRHDLLAAAIGAAIVALLTGFTLLPSTSSSTHAGPDGSPGVPWLAGRELVVPLDHERTSISLTGRYDALARVGDRLVGQRDQYGPGVQDITDATWSGWYVDVLDVTDGERVHRFRSSSPLATSYDGDAAAWVSLDNHLMQWGANGAIDAGPVPDPVAWPRALVVDDACRGSGTCPVWVTTESRPRRSWLMRPGAEPIPLPIGDQAVVATCGASDRLITVTADDEVAMDTWLVDPREPGASVALPRSDGAVCSPDGAHVAYFADPELEEPSTTVAIADARTGTELARARPRGASPLGGLVWEDSAHVLMLASGPDGPWMLDRVGLDASISTLFTHHGQPDAEAPWRPVRLRGAW